MSDLEKNSGNEESKSKAEEIVEEAIDAVIDFAKDLLGGGSGGGEEEASSGEAGESQIDGAEYVDAPEGKSGESQIDGAEYVDAPEGKSGESQIDGAEYVDAPEGISGESQIDGAVYVDAPEGKSGESQIDGAEYVDAPAGKSGDSQIDGAKYADTPSGKSGKSQIKGSKVYSVKPKKSGKSRIDELKAKPPGAKARPDSTNYYTSSAGSGASKVNDVTWFKSSAADNAAPGNSYSGGLAKATILNLDAGNARIECQFNPTEYTMTKRNMWRNAAGKGKDVASPEFKGGKPAQLKMELFFDTTASGKDVRTVYTDKIWDMMKVIKKHGDTKKGQPAKCQFWWGSKKYFTATITQIRQKFIMFKPDGTPLRAKLNVTFQQLRGDDGMYGPQNPTSMSEARKTYVVNPGDRIDLIAFQEYGDATLWHDLATANQLENPMELKVGQVLKIVDL